MAALRRPHRRPIRCAVTDRVGRGPPLSWFRARRPCYGREEWPYFLFLFVLYYYFFLFFFWFSFAFRLLFCFLSASPTESILSLSLSLSLGIRGAGPFVASGFRPIGFGLERLRMCADARHRSMDKNNSDRLFVVTYLFCLVMSLSSPFFYPVLFS